MFDNSTITLTNTMKNSNLFEVLIVILNDNGKSFTSCYSDFFIDENNADRDYLDLHIKIESLKSNGRK